MLATLEGQLLFSSLGWEEPKTDSDFAKSDAHRMQDLEKTPEAVALNLLTLWMKK